MSAAVPASSQARVSASFERQRVMVELGGRLLAVRPGEVEIELPFAERLTQQHGFVHGGIVATLADTACGYAALTLMPEERAVLTVEFKINFLAPAVGRRIIARGRVIRSGGRLTICQADAFADDGERERHVATMTATLMAVANAGLVD